MYKKTLRWISTLLTLTILLQLSPTAFLSSITPTADASSSAASATAQYEYETPQATSSIAGAALPSTFTDETEGDILGRIDVPNLTQNDIRYLDIVSEYSLYSSLPEPDAVFLCEYTGIASTAFVLLEQNGLLIPDSISFANLAVAFGYGLSTIISADPTSEEASDLMAQISLYNNIIDPELDTETDAQFRSQIFQGYTCEQVLNAYGVSQVHPIDSGTLLSGGSDLSSVDLPESELTQINAFSSSLGISSVAIANHVTQNNVSTSAVVSSTAQIETAVAGITSSNYPTGSSSGTAGESAVFLENIASPYVYSHSNSEQAILNSGALVYENVDYILPGVNGLNLVIARRYNSHSANVYVPTTREAVYPIYAYFVTVTAVAYYYVPGVGTGRWSYYDFVDYLGPYSTRTEAQEICELLTGTVTIEDYSDGADLIYEVSSQVTPIPVDYTWYLVTSKENNTYLNDLYGLGQGWSLQFSSVQIFNDTEFLHLSDGSTYETDWSTSNPSHLKGYALTDKVFERNITEFLSGSTNSNYRLTYQDGKREYFSSDGKLIGICDRYGNSIKFEHSTLNGYPYIKITDTLNRITIISGAATDTGHVMAVTLPDGTQILYYVTQSTEYDNVFALSSVTDFVDRTTSYGYTLKTAGFNTVSKGISGGTNIYVNLTTITHPTGAQTQYSYETDTANLGSTGLTEVYRLASRVDDCGDTLSNQVSYTYSDCDNTGYPSYYNPDSLPNAFTYSTTVNDSLGNATTTVFNKDHLAVSSTVSTGETTLQSVHYEYINKLPTKTTTRIYNAAGDYIETIEVAEYDSKGNVTAQWSSYAGGDTTNTEYKTTYTYDTTYGIPLTQTYKPNADTTVLVENTLDSTGKNIASTKLYVNGVVKQRTDYTYDTYGNITQQKRFYDNMTDYALTEYTYDQNGAYLTQEKHTGILSADGTAAAGTPGQAAGTIVTTHTYDSMGRRLTTTDGNGNTTSYTYDAAGNVTLITNPDNTTVTYTRDYANNKVTVTDENGAQVTYIYTPLGLEYETVDTLTNLVINRKEYDAQSRLMKYYDYVYGAVTEYTYDSLDRVTSETVYQGTEVLAQTTYAYDDAAENGLYQKVTKTIVGDANAPSIVTTQYTDKHGNVVKTGKFLGGVEYFDVNTYDYVGNVLTTLTAADAQKNLDYTARYVYNGTNQVVTAYNALGQSTTNTYNALGQLVSTTDYAGTPTAYTYDALGRLLTQSITIQDGVTATNKYDYDPAGNIIREYKPTNAVGSTATWAKTEYSYDSRQRLTSVAQYQGSAVASVTRYTYDGVGNTLTMTTGLPSLTDTTGNTTTYTYDRFGNVLTTTDALGKVETNTYSDLGRLSSTVDRNGITTSYSYDALGRTLSTTAGEDVIWYTYTKTGQTQRSIHDDLLAEYTYDELGRVSSILERSYAIYTIVFDLSGGTFPLGQEAEIEVIPGIPTILPSPAREGHTFMGWYLNGAKVSTSFTATEDCTLVARWLAHGAPTYTITYHPNYITLGFETIDEVTETVALGQDVTLIANPFTRDGYIFKGWSTSTTGIAVYRSGQVIAGGFLTVAGTQKSINLYAVWQEELFDGNTSTMSVGDDGNSGVAVASTATGTTSTATDLAYTKTYTYDLAGNRTGFTVTSDGETLQSTTYTYDNLNRLSTVSEGGTLQATYTYDANGNRQTLTYANGVEESYQYNKANWITSLTNKKDNATLSSYTYTYYASGSQKSETTNAGVVTSYTYDDLGRLTQESETNGLTLAYTYDANGNRTQMTASGTDSYTTAYTYDANNRLTTEAKTQSGTTTTSVFTYDDNGNLLTELDATNTAVVTHSYDDFNRLISSVVGTTTITYTYNAQGIRTSRYVNGTLTQYLLDGGNMVGEVTDGTLSALYVRGANLISDGTNYYLYNAHGDVVQLTDSTGAATKTYEYDAFGNEKNPSDTDTNPFRYCGEYYDTTTGLYYLRARYYDPSVGRFTQEDTHWNTANMIYGDNPQKINEREDALGLKTYSYAPQISAVVQSGNLYVYCSNNPVLFADWSGKWQGLVHNWVVNDIVLKYSYMHIVPNLKIQFLPGYTSSRGVRYGLADLIRIDTGEVWEVKRITISEEKALDQLDDYIKNRINPRDSYPDIELIKLCAGGSKGTRIAPATIVRFKRNQTYVINYWDVGNGIIFYDYRTYRTELVKQNSEAFIILLSSGLLFSIGGGARIGIESIAWGTN